MTYTTDAPRTTLQPELCIEMYRQMVLIRHFEELALKLRVEDRIHGVVHPYSGQEAIAVGVCANLRITDRIVSNHRGHGQPGQISRDVGSGQADVGHISKRRAKHTERRRRDQQCRDGEDNRHNSSWPMPASARLFHANAGLTGEQLCTGQRCERGRSADAAFGHCGRRTGRGLR